MRNVVGLSALFLILGLAAALAQATNLPSDSSMKMEMHGRAVADSSATQNSLPSGFDEFSSDIPPIKYQNLRTARRLRMLLALCEA
jgi:hypothetical protein